MTGNDWVRLSVNLALDVANVLRQMAREKRISATEAMRRAIAVWNFIETEREKGNQIVIVERVWWGERIREVEFDD